MAVLRNIGMLATCSEAGGQGEIHVIPEAAMAWSGDTIVWIGREEALPKPFQTIPALNAQGKLVIPGLVDCHTHLAFGGWRSNEFEQRILGKSYLEIAKNGGGIASTVRHTTIASKEQLYQRAKIFLKEIGALGITTIECKSGYGLSVEEELKQLEVYQMLIGDTQQPLRLVPTYLAHIIPFSYKANRAAYIALIKEELLPRIANDSLAKFIDVFVEESAFKKREAQELFEAAKPLGFRPKLHADQLTDGGGAQLAASVNAISADHLECISDAGIAALKESGTIAVSLPIASLYLNQKPLPARKLIEAQVPVAVATDFNPGSAPSFHLPFAMMLACTLQQMTPTEALKGATLYAAKAIGMEQEVGSLEVGKKADFAIIDAPDVNQWLYHFVPNAVVTTYVGGKNIRLPELV